jgi:hypothetical protein
VSGYQVPMLIGLDYDGKCKLRFTVMHYKGASSPHTLALSIMILNSLCL